MYTPRSKAPRKPKSKPPAARPRPPRPPLCFFHPEVSARVTVALSDILTRLERLTMGLIELKATLARITVATDNIAADIRGLKDGVKVGMTDAEVAEVQSGLDKVATSLEAIDAETDPASVA